MADQTRALAATVAGAVIGAVTGYMLFTEQGRMLRRRMEVALDEFAREIHSLEGTMQKAASTANEGWRVVTSAAGNRGSQPPPDSLLH